MQIQTEHQMLWSKRQRSRSSSPPAKRRRTKAWWDKYYSYKIKTKSSRSNSYTQSTAGLGVQEAAGTPRVLADQGETGDPGVEVTQECIRDLILYQDPLTVLQGPNQGVRDPS